MDVWVCYWKHYGDSLYSDVHAVFDSEDKANNWVKETKEKFASSSSSNYWLPVAVKLPLQ